MSWNDQKVLVMGDFTVIEEPVAPIEYRYTKPVDPAQQLIAADGAALESFDWRVASFGE
jgi:hypothetical protein